MNCLPISKASELSQQSIRIINIIKWLSLVIAIFGMIAIFKIPSIGKTGGGLITGIFGTAALILGIYNSRNNRLFSVTIKNGSVSGVDMIVDVRASEKVSDLVKKIRSQNGLEEDPYYLSHNQAILKDELTIREAGITAGAELQLSRKAPPSSPDSLRPGATQSRSRSVSELRQ